ncbi:MAG: hypothetical protein R3A80_07160 [Bdellovibrionota bacterium]
MKFTRLSLLVFILGACQTTQKPVKPMIFASSAMKAADRARAERLAPDLYRRAEVKYWAAKTDYLQRNFEAAEKNATEAKRLFERAELRASLQALEEADDE